MYIIEVINYSPLANELAKKINELANEMYLKGYELISFSVTNSAKCIVVFKKIVLWERLLFMVLNMVLVKNMLFI